MPTKLCETAERSDPRSIAIDMENGVATIRDLAAAIAFIAAAPHGDEEVSSIERLANMIREKIEILERQRSRAAGQER
jgi:hypothetical protein